MAAKSPHSNWAKLFPWGFWLAIYWAFSFAMLGVDAAMNHHAIIRENPWSLTPIIFAPLAVIVSLICVFSASWRRQAWIPGVVALLVGIAGTLFHNIPTILERGHQTVWQALLNTERPVLAPAAFAATGLLLLLVAWGERWQRAHTPIAEEKQP